MIQSAIGTLCLGLGRLTRCDFGLRRGRRSAGYAAMQRAQYDHQNQDTGRFLPFSLSRIWRETPVGGLHWVWG